MELKPVRCTNCGKLLLEATGEVKKICPNCKKTTHVVVTSIGTINLDKSCSLKNKSTLDKSEK